MKEINFPCEIGDKIYILRKEKCLWGHSPFDVGNACLLCDEEECNYGYYTQEKIVTGFHIDRFGVWIEVAHKTWNGQEEQIIKHSNGLGSEFFFDKTEAKKYAEICNKHLRKKEKSNERP